MDDDAHEVGLGGCDDADGLRVGQGRRILEGEDGSQGGGELFEGLLCFQEVLAWGLLLPLLVRVSVVSGGGRRRAEREAPEATVEDGVESWE